MSRDGKTQCEIIIGILRKEGKIDNYRAINEKITLRLAARIGDLKEKGWGIEGADDPNDSRKYIYTLTFDPVYSKPPITQKLI